MYFLQFIYQISAFCVIITFEKEALSLIKLYLDNFCYNRPFDDQTQMKIHLETQAKLYIQAKIKEGLYTLVWSYILD